MSERTLDDVCFYQPRTRMQKALSAIGTVDDMSVNYMCSRLGASVRHVPDFVLRFVYQKRAGEIVRAVKPY